MKGGRTVSRVKQGQHSGIGMVVEHRETGGDETLDGDAGGRGWEDGNGRDWWERHSEGNLIMLYIRWSRGGSCARATHRRTKRVFSVNETPWRRLSL